MNPKRILALLIALAMLAAACSSDASDGSADVTNDDSGADQSDDAGSDDAGSDDAGSDDAVSGDEEMAESDFPVTIESDGGTWTLEAAPQKIVSLSPTATELIFAIGAGEQVIATDEFSNYPAEAPTTELSGWDPNIEAIAAYEPDLVVASNDANEMVAGLTALGIPVLISPAPTDIEQGYVELANLGIATGRVDETAIVVSDLRAAMDAVIANAPDVSVRVYHELDETFFSASSNSFIGAVYSAMGAENVADAADVAGFGFPQLTEEYIVDADPQVIVITDQVTYTADELAARPGWGEISAVEAGNIVVVNADVASRWGPRLPEFAQAVSEALAEVEAAGADA